MEEKITKLYIVEVGVQQNEDDNYIIYAHNKVASNYFETEFIDENVLVFTDYNKAKEYADNYIKQGINKTYAFITIDKNHELTQKDIEDIEDHKTFDSFNYDCKSIEFWIYYSFKNSKGEILILKNDIGTIDYYSKVLAEMLACEFDTIDCLGENQTAETFMNKMYCALINNDTQTLGEVLETLINIDSRTEFEDELITQLERILEEYDLSCNLTQTEIETALKPLLHDSFTDLDELADILEQIFGQFITIDNITRDDDELDDYNLLFALNNTFANGEIDYNSEYAYIDIYALKDRNNNWYITAFSVGME